MKACNASVFPYCSPLLCILLASFVLSKFCETKVVLPGGVHAWFSKNIFCHSASGEKSGEGSQTKLIH